MQATACHLMHGGGKRAASLAPDAGHGLHDGRARPLMDAGRHGVHALPPDGGHALPRCPMAGRAC